LFGNNSIEGGGLYMDNTSQVDIKNSILWNNDGGEIRYKNFGTRANIAITYSNITGGCHAGYSQCEIRDVINKNPIFIDNDDADGNLDLHLGGDSPCIDTGDASIISSHAKDLDGNTRIMGKNVDMGAYEYIL
jgi:hypothetical protein